MSAEVQVEHAGLDAAIRAMAADLGGQVFDKFVDTARGFCSRREGDLWDSIEHDGPIDDGTRVSATAIAGADHASYQNDGVGEFGPEGARIQGNPLLAFDWPAAGGLVVVRSVAGYEGTHFWDKAIDAWDDIVSSVG